jgi:hypothetical protein
MAATANSHTAVATERSVFTEIPIVEIGAELLMTWALTSILSWRRRKAAHPFGQAAFLSIEAVTGGW